MVLVGPRYCRIKLRFRIQTKAKIERNITGGPWKMQTLVNKVNKQIRIHIPVAPSSSASTAARQMLRSRCCYRVVASTSLPAGRDDRRAHPSDQLCLVGPRQDDSANVNTNLQSKSHKKYLQEGLVGLTCRVVRGRLDHLNTNHKRTPDVRFRQQQTFPP